MRFCFIVEANYRLESMPTVIARQLVQWGHAVDILEPSNTVTSLCDLKQQVYDAYVLKTVLAKGLRFPFDFGSIPGTVADDGDPLDALVLMDEPAFTGCLVETRLIGVIEAEQTKDGKKERNDRLVAVAAESPTHGKIESINDLDETLVKEIEHFFVFYNRERGKEFKPLGRFGPKRATRLVRKHARKKK